MNTINLHDTEILTADMLAKLNIEFYYMLSQDARDRIKADNSINIHQYQICSSAY